ncbi:MAG: hypothetical protein EBT33_01800 [Betaproteobacteria bacterium]|nr:hypothetical protein [Betaproteobacteria bacterium]
MSDRSVSLDLRTLAGDSGTLPGQRQPAREAPTDFDQALAERFAAALLGARTEPEAVSDARVGTPFSLLRTLGESAAAEPASRRDGLASFDGLGQGEQAARPVDIVPTALPLIAPPAASGETGTGDQPPSDRGHREQLLQTLTDMASRLAVGDGRNGERAVRIELTDSALPGVTVSVYLAHGEWIADFTCAVQTSFQVLAGEAGSMAQQLADMLQAPACWLVAMNPPERDPVEARALPGRTLTE